MPDIFSIITSNDVSLSFSDFTVEEILPTTLNEYMNTSKKKVTSDDILTTIGNNLTLNPI